ncbi:diacylglycerol/lipid kinase family protein [Actinotalea solisilvae]|uniref:diacylglycerol/lipid kinase family protein n=1 Tax=Actinotalea solisilvae TaxID=2072922 RepID=UPI0027DBE6B0|nr:diacylglycerol kinase family lipid kinase [Actinotalea solisilvae]
MTGLRLGVVVNPTAGSGRGSAEGHAVVDALTRRGHDVRDLTAHDLPSATQHARQAVVDGLDALVVVGGDGMVNLGANVVAETDLPLGIVAAGSGNDIARGLGLPRHDVDAAVARIEAGLERGPLAMDAAVAGPPGYGVRQWYLAVLSAGFDAAVNARANTLRRPRGTLRYVRALALELRSFAPYGYRITLDDGTWESLGTLVAVANGPSFGGGMRIAPDADTHDGLLDVVVAGPLTRAGLVAVFPRVFSGRHVDHPAVQVLRSRRVLVEPSVLGPPPPVAFVDGERLGPAPLLIESRPGAVRVLA